MLAPDFDRTPPKGAEGLLSRGLAVYVDAPVRAPEGGRRSRRRQGAAHAESLGQAPFLERHGRSSECQAQFARALPDGPGYAPADIVRGRTP